MDISLTTAIFIHPEIAKKEGVAGGNRPSEISVPLYRATIRHTAEDSISTSFTCKYAHFDCHN